MSLAVIRDHTDAIIAALAAGGLQVGDARAPEVPLSPTGYVVVYQIPGGGTNGTLARPQDDVTLVYQVTCVGSSRKQAEWLADKVSTLLLDQNLTVTNRSIPRVSVDMHGGTQRDDSTAAEPRYWSAPRFRIMSTPS